MRLRLNSFINEREKKFLKQIEGKKIICYGISTEFERVNKTVYVEDLIEFFVDKDSSKWGGFVYGKEIKSPEEIRFLSMKEYAVVVLDADFDAVGMELNDMGLQENVNYFNLFEMLFVRELKKHINVSNKLLAFLETVPREIGSVTPDRKSEKIGIVLSIEGLNFEPDYPYCIALFLILKWRRYNVKLIVDDLHWTGDIELYDGYCDDCKKIEDILIRKLKEFVPEDDILYISECGKNKSSSEDLAQCEKVAQYSADWQKWKNLQKPRYMSREILQKKYADVFRENIGYVDAFFESRKFDTVNVSTALHKRAGIIHYVCKKKGMRVSSQDGCKGVMGLSADGVSAYGYDVARTVREKWIPSEKEKSILKKAAQMAEERFTQSTTDSGISNRDKYYQVLESKGYAWVNLQPPREDMENDYDVFIPLNLMYDAAALAVDSCFHSVQHWLSETLDFIINGLGRSVLLREHPCARLEPSFFLSLDIIDIAPDVLRPYQNSKLLHYVRSNEDINSYQYMEQCKVVLPWTGTMGVEAALMKKNVVVHTNAFYADSSFVLKASSKEEYFSFIRKCISAEQWLVEDETKAYQEALKYFYLGMNREQRTVLTIYEEDYACVKHGWLGLSFEELLQEEGIDEIVQIVAENVPSAYLAAKQRLG